MPLSNDQLRDKLGKFARLGPAPSGEAPRVGLSELRRGRRRPNRRPPTQVRLVERGDDLLVKEFGRQTQPPLVIDLDRLAGASLEERISRAAWLVRQAVQERPVGLSLGDRTIAPAVGRAHRTLLLKELALYGLD